MTRTRVNSWDRRVRPPNVVLSDVQRGIICKSILEKFPDSSIRSGSKVPVNRTRLAGVAIFVAGRQPPPDTVEVTKGMFPSVKLGSKESRISAARIALSKLRDAGILEETYEQRFVGKYARRDGGAIKKTNLLRNTQIRQHTAHWQLAKTIAEEAHLADKRSNHAETPR